MRMALRFAFRFRLQSRAPDHRRPSRRQEGHGQRRIGPEPVREQARLMSPSPRLAFRRTAGPCIRAPGEEPRDRKSTRLTQSLMRISYAVFCLKKKKQTNSKLLSHVMTETITID